MRLVETSTVNLSKRTPTTLVGEFASFDTLNQNGRVYPAKIYETALDSLQEKVKSRSLLGECDHPISYDEVRLSNVSHVITEMHVEDTPDGHKKVVGEVELLNTPAGKIVQSLVEAGIPIGISSRATGDAIEENGHEKITELNLITYDLVADPSFKTAVLSESAKSSLGESLKKIEKQLPLTESRSSSPIRSKIKQIRESLLRDSSEKIQINDVSSTEISVLRSILDSKVAQLSTMHGRLSTLSESVKRSSSESVSLRKQLKETTESLTHLRKNMEELQDAYNKVVETTVPQTEIAKLNEENLTLRKRLIVESKGLVYSQVQEMLEGATTEDEIKRKLDTLTSHARSKSSAIDDLREAAKVQRSASENVSGRRQQTALMDVISRV